MYIYIYKYMFIYIIKTENGGGEKNAATPPHVGDANVAESTSVSDILHARRQNCWYRRRPGSSPSMQPRVLWLPVASTPALFSSALSLCGLCML